MCASYNLRSVQKKKGIPVRNCHLQSFAGNRLPTSLKPNVCLERLKLLECHDIQDYKFYVKNNRIIMKCNKSNSSDKTVLNKTLLFVLFLIITSLIYFKEDGQKNAAKILKKFPNLYPGTQNSYSATLKPCISQFNFSEQKTKKENKDLNFVIPKENLNIRQIVEECLAEIKEENKIQNILKTSGSFIEEQCKAPTKDSFSAVKNVYNTTLLDGDNLIDFALESQGAKIVTVYDTEPYGTVTLKLFNFNLWSGFSHFLLKFLKACNSRGPNSVLTPWRKPGDCWAFKGSRGKIQIELSEEIIITAVSIDHIAKESIPQGYIESAPKDFFLFGIRNLGNNTKKTYLGGYEYKRTGPSTQSFPVQSRVKFPFRRIEVIFESNHGCEKYTCVYKIRVHGHK